VKPIKKNFYFNLIDTKKKLVAVINRRNLPKIKYYLRLKLVLTVELLMVFHLSQKLESKAELNLKEESEARLVSMKKTCETHGCVLGEVTARPFLAIYVETIVADLEGGIRWSPYVKASYCATANSHAHFKLDLVPNTINLYYKVEVGWGAYSTSGEQEVYKTREPINLYGHDG